MYDPFPIPPIPWLSTAIQPLAEYLHLTTITLHIHEVLFAFLAYTCVDKVISPKVSSWLFPSRYVAFSRERKLNWNVHVVSLVQSITINTLALWVMFVDEERKNMNWKERVWGYTGAAGMIQALATGYFLWDLIVSAIHVKIFGVGLLAHAVSALLVFSFGFRPFVNFYACNFVLYEFSSPFLNIHWFLDKLGMTGSRVQLYNGVILLFTFFCCRLVWGTYQSVRVYQDIWSALNYRPDVANFNSTSTIITVQDTHMISGIIYDKDYRNHLMRFSGDQYVPLWLSLIYFASNFLLNCLNFYWFRLMITTMRRRFEPKIEPVLKSKPLVDGKIESSITDTNLRKRQPILKN